MIKEVENEDFELNMFLNELNIDKPINSPYSINVVYRINDLIIGYLNYSIIYEKAEINNIFILEQYRNQGIGSKLIEYLLEKCKICENITLEVRKDNEKALRLYKKYGFKEVALRKNYYNGIDGILMMREGD